MSFSSLPKSVRVVQTAPYRRRKRLKRGMFYDLFFTSRFFATSSLSSFQGKFSRPKRVTWSLQQPRLHLYPLTVVTANTGLITGGKRPLSIIIILIILHNPPATTIVIRTAEAAINSHQHHRLVLPSALNGRHHHHNQDI